jgi:hypothetical protein
MSNSRKQMASVVALMMLQETQVKQLIGRFELEIKMDILSTKVIITVGGLFGDKLGNPYIVYMFNEYLTKDCLPGETELADLVYDYYNLLVYNHLTEDDLK